MVNNFLLNVVGRGSFWGEVARIPLIYLITFLSIFESFFVWCCFCGCC